MKAFLKFNRGVMKMPLGWRIWMLLLALFASRQEAQIVIVTLLVSVMLMTLLTALSGFSRLVGLGHVVWVPLIIYLWGHLDVGAAGEAFGVWIRILIGLNAASLLLDALDAIRYARGDRKETVPGLSNSGGLSFTERQAYRGGRS